MFDQTLVYNDNNREEVILTALIIKKFIKYCTDK